MLLHGVRAYLQVCPFQQAISVRRFELFNRILDSKAKWLLGSIIASCDQQSVWATDVQTYFKWSAKHEVGESPTEIQLLHQAVQATKKRWNISVKTAAQTIVLMQATEDDLAQLERFEPDAFGSIGLKVGLPSCARGLGMLTMLQVFQEHVSNENA